MPKEYGGTPPEDMDAFFELIMVDEVARAGGGGALGQVRTFMACIRLLSVRMALIAWPYRRLSRPAATI